MKILSITRAKTLSTVAAAALSVTTAAAQIPYVKNIATLRPNKLEEPIAKSLEAKGLGLIYQMGYSNNGPSNRVGFKIPKPFSVKSKTTGKEVFSARADFAGLKVNNYHFDKSVDGLGTNTGTISKFNLNTRTNLQSGPLLERGNLNMKVSNITETNSGIKLGQDTAALVTPNGKPDKYSPFIAVKNLLGARGEYSGNSAQAHVMLGLASEKNKPFGFGFNLDVTKRILKNFFAFSRAEGTLGAKNTEISGGILYNIQPKKSGWPK